MLSCFVLRIGVCVLKKKCSSWNDAICCLWPFIFFGGSSEAHGPGGTGEKNYIRGFALCVSIPYPVPMHLRAVPHVLHSGLRSGLLIAATLAWLMLDLKWKWSIHRRCEAVCSLDWLSAQAKEPCWRAAPLEEFAEERISLHAHHWWAKAKELWWKCNLRQFQVH